MGTHAAAANAAAANANAADGPDFDGLARESQPNQCQRALLEKKRAELERELHVAAHALEPDSDVLGEEEFLGKGGFGGVTKAKRKDTNETWAIKRAVDVSRSFMRARCA